MSGVRLGFLSDSPLIVAQAHTRRQYLVQLDNREQCYTSEHWLPKILMYTVLFTFMSCLQVSLLCHPR